jgi:hypothetical protein
MLDTVVIQFQDRGLDAAADGHRRAYRSAFDQGACSLTKWATVVGLIPSSSAIRRVEARSAEGL